MTCVRHRRRVGEPRRRLSRAVAEERGWEHNGHWELHNVVSLLVEESGDDELRTLFAIANHLYINFYEGWLDRDTVAFHLRQVARFIDKVEALLP